MSRGDQRKATSSRLSNLFGAKAGFTWSGGAGVVSLARHLFLLPARTTRFQTGRTTIFFVSFVCLV